MLSILRREVLTHWGRATHICVSKLTIIASDNGLSPGQHQAIIWNNAGILSIRLLGTNFSEILIEILTFSFKKMRLKVSSAKWRPFCLGLNVLNVDNKFHQDSYISFLFFSAWSQFYLQMFKMPTAMLTDQIILYSMSRFIYPSAYISMRLVSQHDCQSFTTLESIACSMPIVNWTNRNKLQWNINKHRMTSIQGNVFENAI